MQRVLCHLANAQAIARSNPVGVWWSSSCPSLIWERVSPSADTGWGVLGNYLHGYIRFFFVGVETDEGIREDLARSVSSACIGLHPKQTEAGTQANSIEGEVSSLMKGCEVSGIIMVQLQVFVPHLWSEPSRVHVLNVQEGSPPNLHPSPVFICSMIIWAFKYISRCCKRQKNRVTWTCSLKSSLKFKQ